jgi:hypothetical protein
MMNVLVSVAAWFFVLGGWVTVFKMWREGEDHWSYQKLPWFQSDRAWRAYRRATLPGALFLTSITLAYSVPSAVPYAGIGFLLATPLIFSTALFNRPKFLVPPRLRAELSFWRDRPAS